MALPSPHQSVSPTCVPGTQQTSTTGEPQVPVWDVTVGLSTASGVSVQVLEDEDLDNQGLSKHHGPVRVNVTPVGWPSAKSNGCISPSCCAVRIEPQGSWQSNHPVARGGVVHY